MWSAAGKLKIRENLNIGEKRTVQMTVSGSTAELTKKENPAQKSRVCPIYPYTYEIRV